ncbi:MAG: hypothetical protein ACK4RF_00190 [Cyclobacteriaceae bacterium]
MACLAIASCSPVFYSNVGQNVPLFRKKGEVFLAGGTSKTYNKDDVNVIDGLNLMAAAAIDSNKAVLFSFYSLKDDDLYDWNGKGNYIELGYGLFERGKTSKLNGEVFVGLGYGTINNTGLDGTYINLRFLKPFIQPSGGFSTGVLDFAFTPRIGLVQYISNNSSIELSNDFYSKKKSTFVFEPGVTIRLGYRYLKLQYQFSYSTFNYSMNDANPVYSQYESLSLILMISNRWNKSFR